jgi:tripeptidyl-peptidase-1
LKLGLAGVSVLYSSGDYGVAGNGGQCCALPGCAGGEYNGGGSGSFNPSFPGTCPYVTSVGATQVKHDYSITPTVPSPEAACETVIYSGGGFSNNFPLPAYQADAVAFYFQHHTPDKYNSTIYNDSQAARGYPDVSANGANYVIGVDGTLSLVYGTSASSPVFGSVVTMLNNARLKQGKGPIGFLNPTLYAFPDALNDITLGDNQGCGTQGFRAVKGWDPLTGLGTPNYPKLLEVFTALP